VENVLICEDMVARRGSNRSSFIAGPSTRNQRIERLWRDVFRCVTVTFYYTFYAMEQTGILNLDSELHLFVLHHVFLQRINFSLSEFKVLYNDHRLSTEHNWTPNQIWYNGMLNPNNPLAFDEELHEEIDPEFYGEDPCAPFPYSEDNNVFVQSPRVEGQDNIAEFINSEIDVKRPSSEFGIDIYNQVMEILKETFNDLEL